MLSKITNCKLAHLSWRDVVSLDISDTSSWNIFSPGLGEPAKRKGVEGQPSKSSVDTAIRLVDACPAVSALHGSRTSQRQAFVRLAPELT